jgi:phage terminase small subunit
VLNPRQEAFCLAYARTGNATKAALEAGYSHKAAVVQGSRLLTNAKVRARIDELQAEVKSAKIASAKERQEFWTSIFRGELADFDTKDRIKASELLGKVQGDFIEKVEHSGPNGGPIVLGNPWRGDNDPG